MARYELTATERMLRDIDPWFEVVNDPTGEKRRYDCFAELEYRYRRLHADGHMSATKLQELLKELQKDKEFLEKKTKIKPLFDDLVKYPRYAAAGQKLTQDQIDAMTGSFSPQFASLFGGGPTTGGFVPNPTNDMVSPGPAGNLGGKRDTDVPSSNTFEMPLWIGVRRDGPLMDILKNLYSGNLDRNYNGLFVVEQAIKKWVESFGTKEFFLELGGMKDVPPCSSVGFDLKESVWDIGCSLHNLELFDRLKEEKHGTPLRILFSIDCGKGDYLVAQEIHNRGRFFLKGECETANDDIVAFEVKELCYLEFRYETKPQTLLKHIMPDAGMGF